MRNRTFLGLSLLLALPSERVPAQSLIVAPTHLTFTGVADSAIPFAPQTVQLTSTGQNVTFESDCTYSFPAAACSPLTGTTPASIVISPPVGAALYGSTNDFVNYGIPGVAITYGAELRVTRTYTLPPPPVITSVVDAATFLPGPIVPNQFITIFGRNLGALYDMTTFFSGPTPSRFYFTESGRTFVHFEDNAGKVVADAPFLYAALGQVNVLVPAEIAGMSSINIVLTHYNVPSNNLNVPVVDTSPAIFTASGQQGGQGAILNADSRPNSSTNPALKGSVVQIFGEGCGKTNPVLMDGEFANTTGVPVVAPVSLTIGGQPAQIVFSGQAPRAVYGLTQINATVPTNIPSGPQAVVLTCGINNNATQGITLAVQ
jgi:uncharacterized protein (TIGR03437 family)